MQQCQSPRWDPQSTPAGPGGAEQLSLCIHTGPGIGESAAQPGDIRITEPLRSEKTPKIIHSNHYLSLLCPESLQEQFCHTWFIPAPAEQLSLPVLTPSSRALWSRSETRLSGHLFPHSLFHAKIMCNDGLGWSARFQGPTQRLNEGRVVVLIILAASSAEGTHHIYVHLAQVTRHSPPCTPAHMEKPVPGQ